VATPADAALMMQLGMDGVFVGSGEYRNEDSDDHGDDDDAIIHSG
jgi:pyridoxal 5'-phosphate synthase pdxS subunit